MVDDIVFKKVGDSWVAHANGILFKLSIVHILSYHFEGKKNTKPIINGMLCATA